MYSIKLFLISIVTLFTSFIGIDKISNKEVIILKKETQKNLTLHGWLPFWAMASGTTELLSHQEYFTTISPFSLEANKDGSIFNRFKSDEATQSILNSTGTKKYIVVPTIAWFDGEQIDTTLRNPALRQEHIEEIVKITIDEKYDGIDIDYEGKYLKTKNHYSEFIKELSSLLHNNDKVLQCTVEARTPTEDRLGGIGREISHSSDYKVLNDHCDSIRIMAYDQRDDDKSLVYENDEMFYRPVADNVWVEKVIKEALYEVDKKKLVLGVPTYGNVYKQTKIGGKNIYSYIGAINYDNAMKRATEYNVELKRNNAGELQYTYIKDDYIYYITFTDAISVRNKLILAEKYGLSGVSLFKIDGGMDPAIWKELNKMIKI